jgi:hypothetical protein
MKSVIIAVLLLPFTLLSAQNGIVQGKVVDAISNEPLPFASVLIKELQEGTSTDENGEFKIENLPPGLYTIQAKYLGYQTKQIPEVRVTNSRPAELKITLSESSSDLQEVVVKADPFEKSIESPVSVQTLGIAEIERNPGANRDISRVVQSLPGVATTVAFRNDLLVRGGGPSENVFYLDGIEIPVINHFATQGSSGGPVGILNANLLKEAKLYSSAFPANRGGALSSVLELRQKDGRSDRFGAIFTLGSSDVGLTAEGPIGKKANFIVSARHSYLQLLFRALELPFLPTYTDVQFRINYQPTSNHEFTLIGLGAIDQFELNTEANETEYQQYLLDNLPVTPQWNYTRGLVYKNYREKSYTTVAIRRTKLNNRSYKYQNNDESDPDNLIQDYTSEETYNGVRIENTGQWDGWKLNIGGEYEYNTFNTSLFQKVPMGDQVETIDYESDLHFNTFSVFSQASKRFFKDRLALSLGLRTDFSDYSDAMNDPLQQFSPRLSISYKLNDAMNINANTGIYYQLPPLTLLGFENNDGELVNKENGIRYIKSTHFVAGVDYTLPSNTKISVEGFYKGYDDYPFLTRDSITLANLGSNFGAIGNEPAIPISRGRSFGGELFLQQKLFKGFYGLLSYTYVISEFTNGGDKYIPSSWDSRHVLTITGGKKWDNGWQAGIRFGLTGGLPFTPYDVERSRLKSVWNVRNMGLLDYNALNSQRLDPFHFLDIRVDRKWFFDNFNLNIYLDIQNVYANQADAPPVLALERNENGQPISDPDNPEKYKTKFIDGGSNTVLPTLGVIFEY